MRVYFFTNPHYHSDNYSPEIIQLADGFIALGWEIGGNSNYWLRDSEWLIPFVGNSFRPHLVIVDFRFAYHGKAWSISDLINEISGGCPKILLDRQCGQELTPQWNRDGWVDFFDIMCVTDRTTHHPYNSKIIPWQIGVIKEVYDQITLRALTCNSNDYVLYNFRVGHSLRDLIVKKWNDSTRSPIPLMRVLSTDSMEDLNKQMHHATGGRYNISYFSEISKAPFFLVVGGYICSLPVKYYFYDTNGKFSVPFSMKVRQKLLRTFQKLFGSSELSTRYNAIIQWDSFRLWESLVSSTCPICLDFEHWGISLPILPKSGVHYIGLTEGEEIIPSEILKSITIKERNKIATSGRAWFDEFYSPTAQALRLLDALRERNHLTSDGQNA